MHLFHFFISAYSVSAHALGIPTGQSTVGGAVGAIVKMLSILVGMGAVVMVIVGGLQMTLAAGSPARFKQGRETVIYSLIGVVVAIGAYAIVRFVSNQLS